MNLKDAKTQVVRLIQDDIETMRLDVDINSDSPDGDSGKFWLENREARVIPPRDGFYANINTKWFSGSKQPPSVSGGAFYWYVFALQNSPTSEISAYYICDFQQVRDWVLEFDAPLGNKHQKESRWRGDISFVGDSQTYGYFRWGDEPLELQKSTRFIELRNIKQFSEATSNEERAISKNPHWTRDEIILALDIYFKTNIASVATSVDNPLVQELSLLLKKLPIHLPTMVNANFRSPDSVYMKLMNFLSFDPAYDGVGLDASSKLDREVWDEFAKRTELLAKTADSIKANFSDLNFFDLSGGSNEDEGVLEGRILAAIHKRRERSQKIVRDKKREVLNETGKLECEVCRFDFFVFYGELGKEFAECHHKTPLSELSPNIPTKKSDLQIVCSNCHRMIHRKKPFIAAAALKDLVVKNAG